MHTETVETSPPLATAPSLTAYAIETQRLTKTYGTRIVVDGLSLAIPAGRITGFIGHNGAGKTTTLRMLLGLITPTSGSGRVLGHDLAQSSAYLHRVGALIEGPAFHPTLSAADNLRVLTKVARISDRRISEVLEIVDLTARANDKFKSFSLGMKQRLGLAAALLPDPSILILDEPTNGLDPQGIADMRVLLQRFAATGKTVLVSSHLLAEIEHICENLVVIDNGNLAYQGPLHGLTEGAGEFLVIAAEHSVDHDRLAQIYRDRGYTDVTHDVANNHLTIAADQYAAAELNRLAATEHIVLARIEQRTVRLEDAVLELTHNLRSTS